MGYKNDVGSSYHTDRLPSCFTINLSVLLRHKIWIVKDVNGCREIESVLRKVFPVLCFVPSKFQSISSIYRYV